MYNTKVVCTYQTPEVFLETDEVDEEDKLFIRNVIYRQELLDIFEKEDFNENDLSNTVSELYNKINNCEQLRECMRNIAAKFMRHDEIFGLFVLFSYDYMYLTHKCICEFFEKGKISDENIDKLMNVL